MTAPRTDVNRNTPLAEPGEIRPVALGRFTVWPPVVLAPMAGVTNAPFRKLCREFADGLLYVSEMITARGYVEGNRRTHELAGFLPAERPRSLQIYGQRPDVLAEATRRLVGEDRVDHLDMNFGCPVPKVTRHGGGSAIPVRPRLMARLVSAVVENAGDVPVTVKVRKGIDDDVLTYRDAGRVAEECGARAIGLHARTAAQLYAGEADWDAIADLKSRVSILVFGNGDIWEAFDALRMMRATGCDGVIVGRGCLGRPWLFRDLADVFDGREPAPQPTWAEVSAVMRRHADYLADFFGEEDGCRQIRKWVSWYSKGFPGSAAIRGAIASLASLADLDRIAAAIHPDARLPLAVVRVSRAKHGGTQRVRLPDGYLDDRACDRSPAEITMDERERRAFEKALHAG